MKKMLLGAFAVAMLAVAGCGKREMKEYVNAPGKYKAMMFGTPKEQSQGAAGTTMHLATSEERDGAFSVGYGDMPIPDKENAAQIEARLDGARDGAMRNSNQTLNNETKITLDGKHPGRLLNASLPGGKGITRSKFFLVGKRLYVVQVIGKPSFVDSADAKTFLDSFQVTP